MSKTAVLEEFKQINFLGSARLARYTLTPSLQGHKTVIVQATNTTSDYSTYLVVPSDQPCSSMDQLTKKIATIDSIQCADEKIHGKILQSYNGVFSHVHPIVKLGFTIKLSEEAKKDPMATMGTEMSLGDMGIKLV